MKKGLEKGTTRPFIYKCVGLGVAPCCAVAMAADGQRFVLVWLVAVAVAVAVAVQTHAPWQASCFEAQVTPGSAGGDARWCHSLQPQRVAVMAKGSPRALRWGRVGWWCQCRRRLQQQRRHHAGQFAGWWLRHPRQEAEQEGEEGQEVQGTQGLDTSTSPSTSTDASTSSGSSTRQSKDEDAHIIASNHAHLSRQQGQRHGVDQSCGWRYVRTGSRWSASSSSGLLRSVGRSWIGERCTCRSTTCHDACSPNGDGPLLE